MSYDIHFHLTKDNIIYYYFNSYDYIVNKIIETDFYEKELICISEFLLEKYDDGLVLDIGSNLGSFAIPLAKKFSKFEFNLFEPQNNVFLQCCTNIFMNKLTNCRCHNIGLGQINEITSQPILYSNTSNLGGFTLSENIRRIRNDSDDFYEKEIDFQIKKLDDFLFKNIKLIKIDVEGMEKDVILGSLQTIINNNYPFLLFECWNHNCFQSLKDQVIDLIKKIGYSNIYQITDENFLASKIIIDNKNFIKI